MLSTHEFSVGTLADTTPLAMLVPRAKHEARVLVTGTEKHPLAILVDDGFQCFDCLGNAHYAGLICVGLRVEVDETTAFNPRAEHAPLGAVVRQADTLSVRVDPVPRDPFGQPSFAALEAGLPALGKESVGFRHWQLVAGQGRDKRVVWTFEHVEGGAAR